MRQEHRSSSVGIDLINLGPSTWDVIFVNTLLVET
jgi:hypothetical protein